ncbi:copper resistance D domain-containing protein [Mycolicibacterium tokaiense]|uniref:Copper resistance D domain-containing protein n=1 Tax=Mycolicibacterium tokaiense TaxID=39695 RepID=A0A379PLR9_9MYCO|nr:copper resistance D domain-containing protein [Mycolicibacterium tokaiense]
MAFAALATYFGTGLLLTRRPEALGAEFYRSIQLTWRTDLLADQRHGGLIAMGTALTVLAVVGGIIAWKARR